MATPEPPSDAFVVSVTLGPPTVAPDAGAVTEPVGGVLSIRVVRMFELTTFAPSVATARRSYSPSDSGVVSRLAPNGDVLSTEIVVHVPAPAGLRSNVTCVVSADVVVVSATVPLTAAPGSSSVTVGGWLSTTIVRPDETVGPLPATSFASTVTDTGPSGVDVESQFTDAGVPLVVPTTVPSTLKTIWPTPDVASDAEPPSVIVPPACAPGAGAVTAAELGAVLSITFGPGRSIVVTFAGMAASEITSRRSYCPSATAVVSNETDHGEATAVPIVVHVPAPCGERWNATEATPAPGSLGDGSDRETVPERTEPGSTGAPLGGCVSIVTAACRTASVFPTLSTE